VYNDYNYTPIHVAYIILDKPGCLTGPIQSNFSVALWLCGKGEATLLTKEPDYTFKHHAGESSYATKVIIT